MSVLKWSSLIGVTMTAEQRRACLYLERAGQRFLIDFGYGNAIEKARQHWLEWRRTKRRLSKGR